MVFNVKSVIVWHGMLGYVLFCYVMLCSVK
jgi:hypothetical protein